MRWRQIVSGRLPVGGLIVVAATVGATFGATVPASRAADRPTRDRVRAANRAFADGDYRAALDGYGDAEVAESESAALNYNRGLAHYKLGQFTEARRLFNEALATRDLSLEAGAKFNLGNCAYAEALTRVADVPEAVDLLGEAIGFYRHSLDLNPRDDDARINIEMAKLLIKDLLDKQKQQQEQQPPPPDEQQQDEQQKDEQPQNEQQQDEQQQGDPQQDEQQQNEDHPQEQNQPNDGQQEGETQPPPDEPPGDGDPEPSPTQPQPPEGDASEPQDDSETQAGAEEELEMTPEQAERLLQAVRDKERQRRDERARRLRASRRSVLRDW